MVGSIDGIGVGSFTSPAYPQNNHAENNAEAHGAGTNAAAENAAGTNAAGTNAAAENAAGTNAAGVNGAESNNAETDGIDDGFFAGMEDFEAQVNKPRAGDEEIAAALEKHGRSYKSSSVLSSVGRFLQGVCRWFKQWVSDKIAVSNTPQPEKVAYQTPAVEATDSNVGMNAVLAAHKVDANSFNTGRSLTYADLHLETASLSDVRQRAALQDCWLLSSISSVLVTIGSENLSNIIKDNGNGGFTVRLGNKNYTVPAKELSYQAADGKSRKSIFSDSAPWVNVLECAMQMHLIEGMKAMSAEDVEEQGASSFKLDFRSPIDALLALMPGKVGDRMVGGGHPVADKFNFVATAFCIKGEPVVLGKREGYATSLFADGVAVHHAVSVVDVSVNDGTVDILDPYGRMVRLTTDQLSEFDAYTVSGMGEP